MRKLIYLIGFFMVGLVTVAQDHGVKEKTEDGFENMSFQVMLDKDTYILLEPLYATFRFSNQTQEPQTTFPPVFLRHVGLRINFGGEIREFYELSPNMSMPFPLPAEFRPGLVYEESKILSAALCLWFPEPGNYQIQFVLFSADGRKKSISSDPIELTIADPQGVEKEAYEFLNKHEKYSGLFSWVHVEKNKRPLLEEFVDKFSQTPYGELAILHLGMAYLLDNELEKAQTELVKLKSITKKKYLVNEADLVLNEIKDKKAALFKSKPEKQPQ